MSGMSGVDITTLTGNTGGVIDAAVSGNFNIIGSGLVTVTGTPSTNTLTITSTGGVAGQTNHAVIVGTVAGSIASLAANGTTGQLLTGVTGADPAWTTATYPSTVAKGDVLIASANNIVNIVNDVTNAGYVLTVNVGAAPSFQAPSSGTTFASDAETIAGTVTNKAVAPSNLKAKLGLQTIHALPIGASNTAVLGWLDIGLNGQTLMGSTGADCGWTSSPQFGGSVTALNDISSTAGNLVSLAGDLIAINTTSSTAASNIQFQKARGAAALTSGDTLGQLRYTGYDGTGFITGAKITSTNSGTVATNRVAGNLQFFTHPDSVIALPSEPLLRMTIDSTGAITTPIVYSTTVGATAGVGMVDSTGLLGTLSGTAGQILQGGTKPAFSTATYPSTVALGDVLVASATNVVGVVNDVANTGYVLTVNVGAAPSFQAPAAGGIASVTGTANQVTASTTLGAVTLSTPSTFTSPGSVTATTVITAGTGITATSGAITATSGNVVISAGNLALPATNDALTQGVITLNSSAFLHYGHNTTNVILGIGAGQSGNTNALYNTYVGQGAGAFSNINPTNGAAIYNVAIGYQAIGAGSPGGNSNTSSNVAVGAYSLQNIGWNGNHNIGIGYGAGMKLAANNCGDNVMIGYGALTAAVGTDNGNSIGSNVFIGDYSATAITNGTTGGINSNTFVGRASGGGLTTGSIQHNAFFGASTGSTLTTGNVQYNIFLGSCAGNSYPAASVPVSCICIGYASGGSGTETNVLRIGNATGTSAGNLNAAYICGIQGITVTGTAVLISATDQLGIAVSSAKYKKDITDMPDMSQVIDKLRPVTFHYKDEKQSAQLNYGLIAEEVEQVWPEMVAYDKDGNISTLYYQFLAPILLKEVQLLRKENKNLSDRIAALEKING